MNPNCAAGAKTTSVCHYSAHAIGEPSRTSSGFVFSCAPFDSETTDATTLDHMKTRAASDLGLTPDNIVLEQHTCQGQNTSGTTALTTEQLLRHNMASNCAVHNFDVSDVNAMNQYSCQYYGPRRDEHGNVGYNLSDRMTGRLASCDAGGFDPQTEQDIRKIVAHQLSSSAPDISQHHDKIRCDVFSAPMGL